jgi:Chalcone isomerase-like
MTRPALLILAAATMLLLAPPVACPVGAATLEGVTFPDATQINGRRLYLNGMGLRTLTVLNVRVYVAGLYLERPSHDARAIEADPGVKVILIRYLRGGSKEQVERQFRAGERVNCGAGGCPASDQPDFERLIALSPAVRAGDTSTYIVSRQGLTILANGRPLATFRNPDLAFRILDGFIGDQPPSQALRSALLGLARSPPLEQPR